MSQPTSTIPNLPLARSIALLVAAAGAALGLAWLVLLALEAVSQLPYAVAAAGAALLGALVALAPLGMAGGRPSASLGAAMFAGMLIRPVITGLAVAAGVMVLGLPHRPLLLWAVGFYMILLLVEVTLIARQLRTDRPAPGSGLTPAS